MPMPEDERRELGELETQLSRQPRLVKLARRLSSASADTGLRRTSVLWGAGGAVGLSLVAAGAVAHRTAAGTAGVVILIVTLLVAGVAVFVIAVRGQRREGRSAHDRRFHPP